MFFRTIALLSSVVTTQRAEMRQMAVSIASACLSVTADTTQQHHILLELESIWRQLGSTQIFPTSKEAQAEAYFAIGLADCEPTPGSSIRFCSGPERVRSAVRFFRKACALGKKEAFRSLGDIFWNGYGVLRNFRIAAETCKEGISRGHSACKYGLANCYQFGHGVPFIIETAARLYRESANEGCPEGMKTFGLWCLNGQHIQQDLGMAFDFFEELFLRTWLQRKGTLQYVTTEEFVSNVTSKDLSSIFWKLSTEATCFALLI